MSGVKTAIGFVDPSADKGGEQTGEFLLVMVVKAHEVLCFGPGDVEMRILPGVVAGGGELDEDTGSVAGITDPSDEPAVF
jgi:hypothetical protein